MNPHKSQQHDSKPWLLPLLSITLTVALSLFLVGCLSTMELDTARALEAGEGRMIVAVGGAANGEELFSTPNAMISYSEVPVGGSLGPVGEVGTPQTSGWEPHIASPEEAGLNELPLLPIQVRLGGEVGLGGGFQLGVGLELPFIVSGLGGSFGVKWELPLNSEVFSVALRTRVVGSFGGAGSGDSTGSLALVTTQGALLLSAAISDDFVLTLSPQILKAWAWDKNKAAELEVKTHGSAYAIGGALGVAVQASEAGILSAEVMVLRTPRQDGQVEERWLVIPALGWSWGARLSGRSGS